MVLKVGSDMFAKAIIPVSAGNIIIIIIPVLGTER